jgi:putative ABC transport system substrate-binding protein
MNWRRSRLCSHANRLARLPIAVTILLAASAPYAVAQGDRTYRVGVISVSAASVENTRTKTIPLLPKFGFIDNRKIVLIERSGSFEHLPVLMREILAAKPDVVHAIGGDAIREARLQTESVPIVIFGPDPVGLGVAESISRPGGNVTGVVILPTQLDGKRLQLMYDVVGGKRPIAALLHMRTTNRQPTERAMRTVAADAGFELRLFYTVRPEDYASVFISMRDTGVGGLAVTAHPEFFRDRKLLMLHAAAIQLATICEFAEMVIEGCLMSYGPNLDALRERVAYFIARILQGTSPRELPIEQPTKFEFIVNLKAARALAITIPESVLLRADEVIE